MNWLAENWEMVVKLVVILAAFFYAVIQKRSNMKEWLKWAVAEAEKMYGSKTGQLKLRYVYDLFTAQFKWVAAFIPFETFSKWVDEALIWLDKQINTNMAVYELMRK